jgi:hypothetical protein
MRVRVNPNTQVNHQGEVVGGGETIDVPEPLALEWIRDGYVKKAPAPRNKRAPYPKNKRVTK